MVEGIPYVRLHEVELRADSEEEVVVSMELRSPLTNYVGIFHAGALFTAAETAAGVAAHRIVADAGGFVLLRQATVRYTRRAEGAVTVRASVDAHHEREALGEFARDGRADVVVSTEMTDQDGASVFEATFEYALRRGGG